MHARVRVGVSYLLTGLLNIEYYLTQNIRENYIHCLDHMSDSCNIIIVALISLFVLQLIYTFYAENGESN